MAGNRRLNGFPPARESIDQANRFFDRRGQRVGRKIFAGDPKAVGINVT